MANPILSALLKSLGGAVVDAAKMGVLPGIGHTVSGRKKASNCTPCAARARVEAARQNSLMFRGKK